MRVMRESDYEIWMRGQSEGVWNKIKVEFAKNSKLKAAERQKAKEAQPSKSVNS